MHLRHLRRRPGLIMRPLALRTVLVATDLDRSSDAALDTGSRLAHAAGAALHVVLVVAPTHAPDAGVGGEAHEGVRAALRRAGVPEAHVTIHTVPGVPASTIRQLAERLAADLVVVGPHRERNHARRGHELGGTARAVVEHAFAPCLVAARPLRLPLERVLVPIDLSDTARGALLVGLSWASALRVRATGDGATSLTVLHVDASGGAARAAPTTSVHQELEMLGQSAGDWSGVSIRGVTEEGVDAAQTITDYTTRHGTDLVVFGTRGLGLDEVARLGSISMALTERLPHPMLLVPPAVWRAYAALP